MARVICPFCLKPHDFSSSSLQCSEYQEAVPAIYVSHYREVPPLWLATVGFSQHGKTTYLAALTLMLENISAVLNGVFYRPLDQFTMDAIRQMHREAKFGDLPKPSPLQLSRPLLFNVYNLPEKGSRCLVMYDVAGEAFNALGDVSKYVPSIKQVSTTWFLVSIKDLQNDSEGKTITDLFTVYLSGMENLRVDLTNRNLIVVYTKADELTFTPEIKTYLQADPFKGLTHDSTTMDGADFSFREYVEKMAVVSRQLEEYTRRSVRGGAAFINMVRASGMNLVFTLTSALGQSPGSGSGNLQESAIPHRVLDPFLWAINLEKAPTSRSLGLIIDPSIQNQALYGNDFLLQLWDRLSEHGELTTYYLGQQMAVSRPGQRPPGTMPTIRRQRLVGPILEQMPADTRLMVISAGRIIDLADFYTSWKDRLLLVTLGEDYQQSWQQTISYRPGDDPMILVDTLLRL